MKRPILPGIVAAGAVLVAACTGDGLPLDTRTPTEKVEMTVVFDAVFDATDAARPPGDDLLAPLNLCGEPDYLCQGLGPEYNKPFPLPTDPIRDPGAAASGVSRDENGWLVPSADAGTSTYSYIVHSDGDYTGSPTKWYAVVWKAEVPAGTSITMHARSGPTARPDQKWGQWTSDFRVSPVDLRAPGVLVPNWPPSEDANYLQVEFTFGSSDPKATPKLKSFAVAWKLISPP